MFLFSLLPVVFMLCKPHCVAFVAYEKISMSNFLELIISPELIVTQWKTHSTSDTGNYFNYMSRYYLIDII